MYGQRTHEFERTSPPIPPDHLVTTEMLTADSHITKRTVSESLCGLPVYWGDIIGIFGNMGDLRVKQANNWPDGINPRDLPLVGTTLYDKEPQALDITVRILADATINEIQEIQGYSLTGGQIEEILLYRAKIRNKNYFWIAHLARGPMGSGLSENTLMDAQNLTVLSQIFQKQLIPAASAKFSILQPLAVGFTEFHGQQYAYSTVPFVPYVEINVDAIKNYDPTKRKNGARVLTNLIPYYMYALEITHDIADMNETQKSAAMGRILALADGGPSAAAAYPGTIMHRKQEHDLLTNLAILYLTTGTLPDQFNINAGDFMGILAHNGFHRLTLITTRGGLVKIENPHQFANFIRAQSNPLPPYDGKQPNMETFSHYTPEELIMLLRKAKTLIKPEYHDTLLAAI